MNGAKNDVLEKMAKAELILWIRENLFLREEPRWSWVLDKRWEKASEKAEKTRHLLQKIPEFDQEKYNVLAQKINETSNRVQKMKLLHEMTELSNTLEERRSIYSQIDKAQKKADRIWEQLKKEWERESNERSNTNR